MNLGTGRSAQHITLGTFHTCALLDNRQVKCWGWNEYGQLGLGDTGTRGDDPRRDGDDMLTVMSVHTVFAA